MVARKDMLTTLSNRKLDLWRLVNSCAIHDEILVLQVLRVYAAEDFAQ